MTCFQVFFSSWKKKVNSRIRCRVCNRCTLLKHCGGGRGTDRPAERRDEEVWRADSSDRGGRWRHEKRIWNLNLLPSGRWRATGRFWKCPVWWGPDWTLCQPATPLLPENTRREKNSTCYLSLDPSDVRGRTGAVSYRSRCRWPSWFHCNSSTSPWLWTGRSHTALHKDQNKEITSVNRCYSFWLFCIRTKKTHQKSALNFDTEHQKDQNS